MSAAPERFSLACDALAVERGGQRVLDGVSLRIESRECVALIGPNGAGKTTLLLTLLGLLAPAAGRADLLCAAAETAALHRVPPRRRAELFAYLPQAPEFVPAQMVYDVVAGGRHIHSRPLAPLRPADHAAIRAAIQALELTPLAARPLTTLSGGERQKALLAAALAQDAAMLFLDEPMTALDPAYQSALFARLQAWRTSGRGMVLVSHDLRLPAALGARVLALHNGRLAADGPAAEVLVPETLRSIYDAEFESAQTPDGLRFVVPSWERHAR